MYSGRPFPLDEELSILRGSSDSCGLGMSRELGNGGLSLAELVVEDGILYNDAGSGGSALPSAEDTQARVWSMQDELCRKAATVARLQGMSMIQSMEYFCVSEADLKELGNDERRIMKLKMKLATVDALLLPEGQSSVQKFQNPQARQHPLVPSGPSEMPMRQGLACLARDPLPCSNETGSTPSSSAKPEGRYQKRQFWTVDTFMEIYKELTSGSSSAGLEAPARSDDPFGPLDLLTQPLLPIHPDVLRSIQETRKNVYKQLERGDGTEIGSPQYVWSWTVYFFRHIGRPALADEVRQKFKDAHPQLTKKCGGRAIGHGGGQEWLSVPAAMAAAFPNGELSAAHQAHQPTKRSKKNGSGAKVAGGCGGAGAGGGGAGGAGGGEAGPPLSGGPVVIQCSRRRFPPSQAAKMSARCGCFFQSPYLPGITAVHLISP